MLRLGGNSSGAEKRLKARLGGGTRSVLRIAGDSLSAGCDAITPGFVESVRFRPFAFFVSSNLPMLSRGFSLSNAMSEGKFSCRRLSGRGRQRILRRVFGNDRVAYACSRCINELQGTCLTGNFGFNVGGTGRLGAFLRGGQVIVGGSGACQFGPRFCCWGANLI